MNLTFYLPKLLKILLYVIIGSAIIISLTWITTTISNPTAANTDTTIDQTIEYSDFLSFIKYHFSYNTTITQEEFTSYNLRCRNTSEIDRIITKSNSVYAYCRTKDPLLLDIGFSWKPHNLTKKAFEKALIAKVSPYFIKNANSVGHYSCTTDKTYLDTTGMDGVLADCTVTQGSDSTFYLSLFYFYPPSKPNLDQVIDVEGKDITAVHSVIGNIIKKVHA